MIETEKVRPEITIRVSDIWSHFFAGRGSIEKMELYKLRLPPTGENGALPFK